MAAITVDQVVQAIRALKEPNVVNDTLEQHLAQAISLTVSDPSFRQALGHDPCFWQSVLPVISSDQNTIPSNGIQWILKLVRNVAANDVSSQQLARQTDLLLQVERIVRESLQGEDTTNEHKNLVNATIGTQALCNMVTHYEDALQEVWCAWMKTPRGAVWRRALMSADSALLTSVLVLFLNCIRRSHERCEWMVSTTMGQSFLETILDRVDHFHDKENDQHFELAYSIVRELCAQGLWGPLWHAMNLTGGTQGDASTQHIRNVHPRQVILLKFLDAYLCSEPGNLPEGLIQQDVESWVQLLRYTLDHATDILTTMTLQTDTKNTEHIDMAYSTVLLTLQIINHLLVLHDQEQIGWVKRPQIELDVIKSAAALLRQCDLMDQSLKNRSSTDTPASNFRYLKRELVRCLGLASNQDRVSQDRVREVGGIALILSQIRIDMTNPYIREHAIVAMRYILENNADNQALVAELTPVEAVSNPELEQMGLRVTLENGKAKLARQKPSDPSHEKDNS